MINSQNGKPIIALGMKKMLGRNRLRMFWMYNGSKKLSKLKKKNK